MRSLPWRRIRAPATAPETGTGPSRHGRTGLPLSLRRLLPAPTGICALLAAWDLSARRCQSKPNGAPITAPIAPAVRTLPRAHRDPAPVSGSRLSGLQAFVYGPPELRASAAVI